MRLRLTRLLATALLLLGCINSYSQTRIDHDAGSASFEQIPTRVIALTWTHAEILLTLGVTPVGVASVPGYRKWQSNHPPLPEQVVDVGHRANPNLEAMAKLKPDLILGYHFRHLNQLGRLNSLAPTLLYRQYPGAGDSNFRYFDQMLRITRDLGRLLQRQAQAEQAIAEMWQDIEQARQSLNRQQLNGQGVVLGKFVGMGMGLRVFADNALSADIAHQIGLHNRWHFHLPGRDFSHIQLPHLFQFDSAHLIVFGDQSNEADQMQRSALWPLLEFVQAGRFHQVANSWTFGGPVSAGLLAQRISAALLSPAAANHHE